jgi:signal transduction histidine kinase
VENREIIILNVDDREAPRYAKTRSLQHAGFTVADAETGYEALRKAEELLPAVVVLDIKLPDISGIEVCGVVKRRWPQIMVLQTSATYTTGDDRSRGLEGGADAYLTQPIEPRELVAAVRALLRLREAEDKLRRLNETLEHRVAERTRDLATANTKLTEEIEHRKKAEAALVQAQKMEAIGHLTGGIAHDFNNLLTAVIGNLDRIRSRVSDPKLLRLAENAFMAAERGSKLTAQLLAFSRTQKLNIQPVDLAALLKGMSDLLRQSLGPTIEISIRVDATVPAVLADANQLELAILNLAINSRDALPASGGRIDIVAACTTAHANGLPHNGNASDYVDVAVIDNGTGMPPEVLAVAFDPFFTTKPPGKGTGLGLSQVYGIAQQSGGTVHIASEPGKGTTVTIRLRSSSEDVPAEEPQRHGSTQTNSETILVIDDDADVRVLVGDYLSEIGYRAYIAHTGDAALRMLEDMTPDLIIADFAMPGRNGAEIARSIRERLPHTPILFFSGYADTSALDAAVGKAPLLRKPFRPSELATAIRSLLNTASKQ